jgi:hypothetical protein
MQVGIGKRQSNQSIVTEDNAMTNESAAKSNLFESVILISIGTANSRDPCSLVFGIMLCKAKRDRACRENHSRLLGVLLRELLKGFWCHIGH